MNLVIRPMQSVEDRIAFRTLNEEWITRYFVLEQMDRETLGDPQQHIVDKGGRVYLAHLNGEAVGCAALVPKGNGVYELGKMAITAHLRGQGLGRKLLEHLISEARLLGATSLFLGSSTKLPNAVHLYESAGFRHVPADELPPVPYVRADVFMAMDL